MVDLTLAYAGSVERTLGSVERTLGSVERTLGSVERPAQGPTCCCCCSSSSEPGRADDEEQQQQQPLYEQEDQEQDEQEREEDDSGGPSHYVRANWMDNWPIAHKVVQNPRTAGIAARASMQAMLARSDLQHSTAHDGTSGWLCRGGGAFSGGP